MKTIRYWLAYLRWLRSAPKGPAGRVDSWAWWQMDQEWRREIYAREEREWLARKPHRHSRA